MGRLSGTVLYRVGRSRLSAGCGSFLCAAFALCPPCLAGDGATLRNGFRDEPARAAVVAAGGIVGDPLRTAAYFVAARHIGMLADPDLPEPDLVPRVALTGVKDGQAIYKGEGGKESEEEKAYNELLILAHRFPSSAFARTARTDLTFAHLFEQPTVYRGEVVHFDGWLSRLRRFEAPEGARAEGVPYLYEGWMFDPKVYGANPMCVVFTDLPDWLKVGEKMYVPVSFDGYFFKKYRYLSGEKVYRDSPLLVGHAPSQLTPPGASEEGGSHSQSMVTAFLLLIIGVMVLAVGLTWWFRRGDRQVRARVEPSRDVNFDVPFPDDARRDDDGYRRDDL